MKPDRFFTLHIEVTQADIDAATPTTCPITQAVRRHDKNAYVGSNFVQYKGKTYWLSALGRWFTRMFDTGNAVWPMTIMAFKQP